MSDQNFQPNGYTFFDGASGRDMILVTEGSYLGWVCYKHPQGQWVTLKKPSDQELLLIAKAIDFDDRMSMCKVFGHIWNADGERCLVCRIKDWMTGGQPSTESTGVSEGIST